MEHQVEKTKGPHTPSHTALTLLVLTILHSPTVYTSRFGTQFKPIYPYRALYSPHSFPL